jgi:magnesium transporter
MKDNPILKPIEDKVQPVELILKNDQTISDILTLLSLHPVRSQSYLYVTDKEGVLSGVVSLKKLLITNPLKKIEEVMDKNILSLTLKDTVEKALEIFTQHHFFALPVTDHQNKLLGYVDMHKTLGNSLDVSNVEHRSEAFQLVGLHLEAIRRQSVVKNYMMRMPWLFCNLLGGFTCAFVSDLYSLTLSKFLVLAMFIPLVLSLSESVSMMTVMQVLLLMRKEGMTLKRYIQMYIKEIQVVTLVALTCAIIVASLSPFWDEGLKVAVIIGCGIFISIFVSSFLGAILPIVFHKLKLDPKIASGPVVLMIADVATTLIYLTLATATLM